MRRTRVALLVAACLACALPTVAESASRAGTRQAPTRLMVTSSEWRLTLSRSTVTEGHAIVQLLNRGEDAHDLKLRLLPRADCSYPARASSSTRSMAETASGGLSERELRLYPGRYRLWCSLPGHRSLGMVSTLRVAKARR